MAAYDYGLRSVIGAIAGMDIIQVHVYYPPLIILLILCERVGCGGTY